jgi:hypothetical protein
LTEKYEFRSLAEHTVSVSGSEGELKSKKLEKGIPLQYKGTASVRADNVFAIAATDPEASTAPRFTAILEYKPLGEVPTKILEQQLKTFDIDYLHELSLNSREMITTNQREDFIARWEEAMFKYFEQWSKTGAPGRGKSGSLLNTKASNFAGQLAA